MYRKLIFVIFVFLFSTGFRTLQADERLQDSSEILTKADALFLDGQKEQAVILYQEAATLGNPVAHYLLAYRYVLPRKEALFHYSEAAKSGHEDALNEAIEYLFLRSGNIFDSNLQGALNLYHIAQENNPNIHDENTTSALIRCLEMGAHDFDPQAFVSKYKIEEAPNLSENAYYYWELAENFAKSKDIQNHDKLLPAQLVCRGGFVPAEIFSAVDHLYKEFKEGKNLTFNICEHITSGYGSGYCARRHENEAAPLKEKKLHEMTKSLSPPLAKKVIDAYQKTTAFIELKAETEELHGGSGRSAWITYSIDEQIEDYLIELESIVSNIMIVPQEDFNIIDQQLNDRYKKIIKQLQKSPITTLNLYVDDKNIKNVQRKWIDYRDDMAALYASLNQSFSAVEWKAYLTKIRIKDWENILN